MKIKTAPSRGFTLIELIVAITLAGIVAGFGLPGLYGTYQRQQILNSANELVSAIKVTRASALANDQRGNPAQSDCTAAYPSYVNAYRLTFTSSSTYKIQTAMRDSTQNSLCTNTTATDITTKTISGAAATNSQSDLNIYYKTTSGKMYIGSLQNSAASLDIVLQANGYLASKNVQYHVCVYPDKIYAKADNC